MRGMLLMGAIVAGIASAPASAQTIATETGPLALSTVAGGLEHPWGLAVLPDGRLLVTERPGRLRLVAEGKLSPPVAGVPRVAATGQGGLLDVALDPRFAENRLVYLSYAEPRQGTTNGTAVLRAKLVEEGGTARLDDARVIFRQEPAFPGGLHFGSRLAFAPDGNLFVTLGERNQRDRAQDLDKHYGKVVRIRPDGTVPPDNPFVNKPGALPEIWSYGHRNPQGAAIDPATGRLWMVEHGPRGGDELNHPEPGKNYGWPLVTYGVDYSGVKIGKGTSAPGLEEPVTYWVPSISPSGLVFHSGRGRPEWKGNLFLGALSGQMLVRLVIANGKVAKEERLLADFGRRIRDVREAPDGSLLLLVDSARGEILRLAPGR